MRFLTGPGTASVAAVTSGRSRYAGAGQKGCTYADGNRACPQPNP